MTASHRSTRFAHVGSRRLLAVVASLALVIGAVVAGFGPGQQQASANTAVQKMHGEAVDTCAQRSASQWANYWTSHSSVYGLGLYIGGSLAGPSHNDCLHSSSFYDQLTAQEDWAVMPIYDGLQSACYSGGAASFSNSTTTALAQGKNTADTAIGNVEADDMTDAIVYVDIEAFSNNSTCVSTYLDYDCNYGDVVGGLGVNLACKAP